MKKRKISQKLYHHFLETKIRIKFEEKRDPVNIAQKVLPKQILPKKLRQGFEKAKEDFYSDHIQLSSKLLFLNLDINMDDEKIQEIIEYGIVVEFTIKKLHRFCINLLLNSLWPEVRCKK